MDETRPHVAVINVQIEIHALDDAGQCSGKVINAQKMAEYGLKPAFLLRVDGKDAEDCLQNLRIKLEKFNE